MPKGSGMVKIRRAARIDPRDRFEYFRANPELWVKLKEGGTIEVPEELFPQMVGVVRPGIKDDIPAEQMLEEKPLGEVGEE